MENMTKEIETNERETLPADVSDHQKVGTLSLYATKYMSHVEDFDLTEEQKIELLQTLWTIMEAFVDIGFGVDAVQLLFHGFDANSLNSDEPAVEEKKPSSRFNRLNLDARGKEDCS